MVSIIRSTFTEAFLLLVGLSENLGVFLEITAGLSYSHMLLEMVGDLIDAPFCIHLGR